MSIKKPIGADGEALDVYLSQNPSESAPVFVVDQVDADSGDFDEHKCFLGFQDADHVVGTYNRAFDDGRGPDRMGAVTSMTLPDFKEWLKVGDQTQPIAPEKILNMAGYKPDQPRDKWGKWTSEGGWSPQFYGGHKQSNFYGWQNPAPGEAKPAKWHSAGAVVYNDKGEIALVKPKGAFGGYEHTLPKGTIEKDEKPEDAARREVLEESGLKGDLGEYLGEHEGTSSFTKYWLMHHTGTDLSKMDKETSEVVWMKPEEAAMKLDNTRDLRVLLKAVHAMRRAGIKNCAPGIDALLNSFEGHSGRPGHVGGSLPKNSFVDVSSWPAHNTAAQWAAKKIAMLEEMHKNGHYASLKAMDVAPKSAAPNKYQKGVHEAHKLILAKIAEHEGASTVAFPETPKPAVELGTSYKASDVDGKPTEYFVPKGVKTDGTILGYHSSGGGWEQEMTAISPTRWKEKGYFTTGIKPNFQPGHPMHEPNLNINLDPAKIADAEKSHEDVKKVFEDLATPKSEFKPHDAVAEINAALAKEISDLPSDTVDVSGWNKTGGQKGSNPGGVYIDPKTNDEWYVKKSKSGAIAKNEVLAAKLYEAAGSHVPEIHLAKLGDGMLGVASKMLEGTKEHIDPSKLMQRQVAGRDFATHAWLGNWDAVGLDNDNQIWAKKSSETNQNLHTVDVGGSLLYRAQGAPKGKDWDNQAGEWFSMRDPAKSPQAAAVFKDMSPQELIDSGKKVTAVPGEIIKSLVDKYAPGDEKQKNELASTLMARRDKIAQNVAELQNAIAKPKEELNEVPALSPPPATAPSAPVGGYFPTPNKAVGWADYPKTMSKMYGWALANEWHKLDGVSDAKKLQDYKQQLLAAKNAGAHVPPVVHGSLPGYPGGLNADKSAIVKGMYFAASHGDIDTVKAINYKGKKVAEFAPILKYKDDLIAAASNNASSSPSSTPEVTPQVTTEVAATPKPDVPSTKPSIPLPKEIGGVNAVHNKKLTDLYMAAMAGDMNQLHAIQTNPNAKNTYSKYTHQYKKDLLGLLGSSLGAESTASVSSTPSAPKDKPAPIAIKGKDLPPMPELLTSHADWKEQNINAMKDLQKLAMAGDLAGLTAFPVTPSAKVQDYRNKLVDMVTPPMPEPEYEKLHGTLHEVSEKAKVIKVHEALGRIGRFLVLGDAGGLNIEYGKGVELTPALVNSKKAKSEFDSKLSSAEQSAVRSYTGGGYGGMNKSLSAGSVAGSAKTAGGAIMKVMQPIAPNGILYRRFNFTDSKDNDKLLASVGKVIQDPAIISTSIKPHVWSGSITMKIVCPTGVKGLFVNNGISSHTSEHECILPPNTRFIIKKAEKTPHGGINVEAVCLKTLDFQFYS